MACAFYAAYSYKFGNAAGVHATAYLHKNGDILEISFTRLKWSVAVPEVQMSFSHVLFPLLDKAHCHLDTVNCLQAF